MSGKIDMVFEALGKLANILVECMGYTDTVEIKIVNPSNYITTNMLEKIRIKLELGLESVVDAIMETSGVDRATATAKFAETVMEKQSLQTSPKDEIINQIII
jgi:hypothetical protein